MKPTFPSRWNLSFCVAVSPEVLGFLTAIGLFIILMTLLFWFLNNKLALENPASLQCLDDFRKKAALPGECRCSFILFPTIFQSTFRLLATNRRLSCPKIISSLELPHIMAFPQNSPSNILLICFRCINVTLEKPLQGAFLSPGVAGGGHCC